jgi:hypothetical protein
LYRFVASGWGGVTPLPVAYVLAVVTAAALTMVKFDAAAVAAVSG